MPWAALRAAGFSGEILGVSSAAAVAGGIARGAISAGATLEQAAAWADLLYLAQPVDRILQTLATLQTIARAECLITDAGRGSPPYRCRRPLLSGCGPGLSGCCRPHFRGSAPGALDGRRPQHPASVVLTVRRLTAGLAATVEAVVTDGCGDWPTFVGGGPTAF